MDMEELRTTADLARIALGEGDAERLGAEIARMVDYFETMRRFDVEGLEPTTHALVRGNRLRPDESPPAESEAGRAAVARAMLDQAPDLEGGHIVIPNVL
jgi:aspartyl-tRNA(Asn)/glutamyl-tRNA(Gln) amidotransferase subunit C